MAFSIQSCFDFEQHNSPEKKFPFWQAGEQLVGAKQPFDVIIFPDGELRQDSFTLAQLEQYRTLVLPECSFLTSTQAALIKAFLDQGGRVLAIGDLGTNLPGETQAGLLSHPHLLRRVDLQMADLVEDPQVVMKDTPDLAINLQRVYQGVAIHIIRYDYDEAQDAVPILPELNIQVRFSQSFIKARTFSPLGEVLVNLSTINTTHKIELQNVPIYTAIFLEK